MADWGPVFVATILFVLLCPGLLVQIPGKTTVVEFSNFCTSGGSIFLHSVIYFALLAVFVLVLHVHVDIG